MWLANKTSSESISRCRLFRVLADIYFQFLIWLNRFFLFFLDRTGTKNLLKWKGVMFAPETDDKTISEPATTTTSSEPDSSCCTTIATNPTPGTEKEFDAIATDDEGHQVNGFLNFPIVFSHTRHTCASWRCQMRTHMFDGPMPPRPRLQAKLNPLCCFSSLRHYPLSGVE